MITIKHTNGAIAGKDLNKVPKNFVARHSNGVEWIYFENQEEYTKFMNEKYPQTDELKEEL